MLLTNCISSLGICLFKSIFKFVFLLLSCRSYLFNFYLFICLFLAALRVRCCARTFSSCGEWGLLFVAERRPLTAVASLVAERGL